MQSRLQGILAKENNGDKSYYNAVTDDELYVMATATSLGISEMNVQGMVSPEIKQICNTFGNVLHQCAVFSGDGTWLFQPNVWRDHPDFKNVVLSKGQTVNWDVSHFSRMSGFLYVYGIYCANNPTESAYIKKLKTGLSKLFIHKVARYNKVTNSYSFANYIDGNDSYFRVGYRSGFSGYKPGTNQTSIFWAWWKLLGTIEISGMYSKIYSNFNFYLNDASIKRYSDFYNEVCGLK